MRNTQPLHFKSATSDKQNISYYALIYTSKGSIHNIASPSWNCIIFDGATTHAAQTILSYYALVMFIYLLCCWLAYVSGKPSDHLLPLEIVRCQLAFIIKTPPPSMMCGHCISLDEPHCPRPITPLFTNLY